MSAKARTNVTVDAELLEEARTLNLNLSAVLDVGLRAAVRRERAARWLAENRGALDDANAFLAARGLWSDGRRLF
ncbi:MAG TPA: type II toxin-antitoxin system CcdA family antitoxin [Acetobacteraceae bacterium]